jgi:Flp pilus assembly protein TadG
MKRKLVSGLGHDDHGNVMVEAAIVFPVAILLSVGSILFMLTLWNWVTITKATYAGARCGAVGACSDATAVQAFAISQAWGISANSSTFPISGINTTANCPGSTVPGVSVQPNYSFTLSIPFLTSRTISMAPKICMTKS